MSDKDHNYAYDDDNGEKKVPATMHILQLENAHNRPHPSRSHVIHRQESPSDDVRPHHLPSHGPRTRPNCASILMSNYVASLDSAATAAAASSSHQDIITTRHVEEEEDEKATAPPPATMHYWRSFAKQDPKVDTDEDLLKDDDDDIVIPQKGCPSAVTKPRARPMDETEPTTSPKPPSYPPHSKVPTVTASPRNDDVKMYICRRQHEPSSTSEKTNKISNKTSPSQKHHHHHHRKHEEKGKIHHHHHHRKHEEKGKIHHHHHHKSHGEDKSSSIGALRQEWHETHSESIHKDESYITRAHYHASQSTQKKPPGKHDDYYNQDDENTAPPPRNYYAERNESIVSGKEASIFCAASAQQASGHHAKIALLKTDRLLVDDAGFSDLQKSPHESKYQRTERLLEPARRSEPVARWSEPGAIRIGDIESDDSAIPLDSAHVSDSAVITLPVDVDKDTRIVSAYPVKEAPEAYHAEPISHRHLWLVGAAVLAAAIGVVVPVALLVGKNKDGGDEGNIEFEEIVTGLCSPRHLKIFDDTLFVAEAGFGPLEIPDDPETSDLCLNSTERMIPELFCYGRTGQISSFDLNGNMAGEPLTGLFSSRPVRGIFSHEVYGAGVVDFDENGKMFSLVGPSYVNATELALRDPGLSFAAVFRDEEAVTFPWVPVYENNPGQVDTIMSNPFHMIIYRGVTYIVDAAADLLFTYLSIDTAGTAEPDSIIVLPKVDNIPAVDPNPHFDGLCNHVTPPMGPKFCGEYQDNEGNWLYSTAPVPSAVRVNPEFPDRIYIAYLSGGAWNAPVAGIFYMDLVDGIPQQDTLEEVAGGFWAIIDFDFYKGDLFVLETFPGGFVPFQGLLTRLTLDSSGAEISRNVVSESLVAPVGLIVHGSNLYVTNTSYTRGADDCRGQILKGKIS